MGILIYFALLLFISWPLSQLTRITFGFVSFTLVDITVATGALFWIVTKLIHKDIVWSKQVGGSLLATGAFCLSLFVSSFFVPLSVVEIGALYIVRFVAYTCLFFIVRDQKVWIKKHIRLWLFWGGLLLVGLGFLQFFLYPSLRNLIYAGWDEHFYRMFSTFLDPNFFGVFLVCFFLFVVTLTLSAKKISRVWYLACLSLVFVAILLTYSRTALVALVVGLSVLLLKRISKRAMLIFLSGGMVVAVVVILLIGRKAEGNDFFRATSSSARIGDAKNAMSIYVEHPLLGVGFNTYRYAQYKYGFMKGSPTQEDHGASGADTSLLFVLATSGIIGFGCFLYFLYTFFCLVQKDTTRLALSVGCSLLIGSLFVNALFYPSILVFVWILLGVTDYSGQ